jgi:hypothetical protein
VDTGSRNRLIFLTRVRDWTRLRRKRDFIKGGERGTEIFTFEVLTTVSRTDQFFVNNSS